MSSLLARQQARVNLTPKQANIYLWGWQEEAKERYAVCGRRFGKTFLMMEEQRRAVRLAIERNVDTDNEIWYGAPALKQAEKNYWKRALRATPPEWIAHVNNAKHTITYKSGHVFRLVGLDNYDDLRGSGLFFFMGDEWADVKAEVWPEVIEPMLATADGHSIKIGTPKGYNDFYDGFIKGQPGLAKDPNTMSWRYSTLDGGNVKPEWIAKKKATSDERTFRQEYEASFETYSGTIYYGFDRQHSIQVPPWHGREGMWNKKLPLHIGLDFNIDPMTANVFQEVIVDGVIRSYQIDEIRISSSNTHEIANEITNRYGLPSFDPTTPSRKHITIYPDPAGAGRRTAAHGETDVTILRKMGFHVVAMSSHPLVRDRINSVNGKLKAADGTRALFVGPNCPQSIEALEKHQYKEGTSEPDKDSGFDHGNDATGYYIYTRFHHTKPHMDQIAHMGR